MSREEESGRKEREKIEIMRLRQKMERMDRERERAPAYPPLQNRKWSVQRRQNSKPPAEHATADPSHVRRTKVGLICSPQRQEGSFM